VVGQCVFQVSGEHTVWTTSRTIGKGPDGMDNIRLFHLGDFGSMGEVEGVWQSP